MVYNWDARQCGRPTRKIYIHVEAGLCRRPYSGHLGSPAQREDHFKDLHLHGSRPMPEASLCVQGKPDKAGGPVMNTL